MSKLMTGWANSPVLQCSIIHALIWFTFNQGCGGSRQKQSTIEPLRDFLKSSSVSIFSPFEVRAFLIYTHRQQLIWWSIFVTTILRTSVYNCFANNFLDLYCAVPYRYRAVSVGPSFRLSHTSWNHAKVPFLTKIKIDKGLKWGSMTSWAIIK